MNFTVKRGDRLPVFEATLIDAGGPFNLTGCVAKIILVNQAGVVVVNAACTVVDAVGGVVQYAWTANDTATAQALRGEIEVTKSLKTLTFPNGAQEPQFFEVNITPDLA